MTYSYDPECEKLARHFLGGLASERLSQELALSIQRFIETWLEDERERLINRAGGRPQ